ncbi:peptidoglycan-binding protein [bacterium]|nr:peptidoglycan-binding protein [bacterium]
MSTVSSSKKSAPTRTSKPTTSAKRSAPTKKPSGSTQAKAPKANDQVRLSKDAGAQPQQGQVPNFSSWAAPSAVARSPELKPLTGDTLKRKSKGQSVKDLQNHLNQGAKNKLEVDGKFGPLTQKAVRKFQKQHNLTVDGKVGPETMAALNKGLKPAEAPKPTEAPKTAEEPKPTEAPKKAEEPKPTEVPKKSDAPKKAEGIPQLADKKLSTQEKFDHYKAMVEAAGGKVDTQRPTVLGLRGLGIDGKRHDSGKNTGSGDDTFVVLGHDKKGNPTVTELKGATHAAVKRGSVAGGVAQLRPGNYDVSRRHDYKGHDAWAVNGGGNVPVYRDRNRDGQISDAEKAHAVANNTKGDGILFHFDRGVSIGCQTLPVDQLGALNKAVGGGNFRYTLLDANRPQ